MAVKSKSATQVYFNKDHDMVRKAMREFVDKEINPFMDEWEEKGEAPLHDLFKKMGDLGFMNEMLISRSYRDARLIAIGGGADEIMREIIAKMELG